MFWLDGHCLYGSTLLSSRIVRALSRQQNLISRRIRTHALVQMLVHNAEAIVTHALALIVL